MSPTAFGSPCNAKSFERKPSEVSHMPYHPLPIAVMSHVVQLCLMEAQQEEEEDGDTKEGE